MAVALLAGSLLAVSNWHLHLTRVGFALAPWPPLAILAAWALLEARQRAASRSWLARLVAWALAGAASAAGFYTYNGHAILWLALTMFAAGSLLRLELAQRPAAPLVEELAEEAENAQEKHEPPAQPLGRRRGGVARAFGRAAAQVGAWVAGAALALLPMIQYARSNWSVIADRAARDSLFNTPEWLALATPREKLGMLVGRYWGWWEGAFLKAKPDNYVDSLGFAPLMAWALIPLVLAGAWWGWKRYKTLVPLCVLLCLVLPMTTIVSVNGNSRRPFGMQPFLLLLAAIGAVEAVRLSPRLLGSRARNPRLARVGLGVATASVGAWCALAVAQESRLFWKVQPDLPEQKGVYGRDLTAFALWAKTLPPDSYVLFACERWSMGYAVCLWLAPNLKGEDRSAEFAPPERAGRDPLEPAPGKGRPVWVLLGQYQGRMLPELQVRYPGGEIYRHPGDPTFVAYFPPA